jgi:hypothetical protein
MVTTALDAFTSMEKLTRLSRSEQGNNMEMIGLFAFLVVPTLVVGLIMILMGEW